RPEYISNAAMQKYPKINSEFRETEQTNICLGMEGLSVFHPDRFVVDIISMILGEGMSSRLFTEVREKLGLAYDVHSYAEHFRDTGAFVIQAGIDPKQSRNALCAILSQLKSITGGVAEAELRKAKEMAKGRLLLSMENSRNIAGWYGAQEMLTEKILTVDEVTQTVESISLDDLKRVAQDILVTEKLNLAIVGPLKSSDSLKDSLKI
ncbi:MAG: insulinase family protein, partial [Chloroflexi bacterium]|nr:insulinase family protein [Chloroflexota bacterium]